MTSSSIPSNPPSVCPAFFTLDQLQSLPLPLCLNDELTSLLRINHACYVGPSNPFRRAITRLESPTYSYYNFQKGAIFLSNTPNLLERRRSYFLIEAQQDYDSIHDRVFRGTLTVFNHIMGFAPKCPVNIYINLQGKALVTTRSQQPLILLSEINFDSDLFSE